jgi:hypothetical protein
MTGAPPPVPATRPSLIMAAYSSSTLRAVPQVTLPLTILMVTGTSAAVRVVPQVAPDSGTPSPPAPGPPDEHPASRTAPPASSTAAPAAVAGTRPRRPGNALVGARAPARCTLSPYARADRSG